MRTPRLYLDMPLSEGATLSLPDARGHYLTRVLRREPGDAVVVFDGRGSRIGATLTAVGRGEPVQLQLADDLVHTPASAAPITLGMALLKADGLDEVMQKTTELGVDAVQLLLTEHATGRLPDDAARAARRIDHWRAVQVSACEQSGRDWLPALHAPVLLDDWLHQGPGTGWLLEPEATTLIGALREQACAPLRMAIGPEGGWSQAERRLAAAAGFVEVALGTPVLRAETAPLAALAMDGLLRQLR